MKMTKKPPCHTAAPKRGTRASWFLSPMSKNSSLRGVKSKTINSHPGRYLLKSISD